MGQELTIAIVTGLFSVVMVYLGHKIEQINGGKLYKREVLEKQLFLIFEPLDKLMFENPNIKDDKFIEDVSAMVSSNYSLIPVKFLSFYAETKKGLSGETVAALKKCVSANYNWLKKSLRYPYDKEKIDKSFLDNSLSPIALKITLAISISAYLAAIMTFPALQEWMRELTATPLTFLKNFLIAIALVLIFTILAWLQRKFMKLIDRVFPRGD